MRNPILTIALLFIAINTKAQNSLEISGNFNYFGRSISGMYQIQHRDNQSFAVGLNVNINTIAHPDDQGKLYYKRLFATKFIHHFGLRGTYSWYPEKMQFEYIDVFLFSDNQLTYSTTRNSIYSPQFTVNGITYYSHQIESFGPFIWYSQNIGIGMELDLFGRFYLKQLIGVGIGMTFGFEEQIYERTFRKFDWDFANILNVGIGYQLK